MKSNSMPIFSVLAVTGLSALAVACSEGSTTSTPAVMRTVGNPFLPLWEHIPDGEPYVFDDPDVPGKKRVYLYGSHDNLRTEYCGRDQVVWSASADDLTQWRYDGVIFKVDRNAEGKPLHAEGLADVLYAPDVAEVTEPDGRKMYYLYPNDQAGKRNGLVARSRRPDGPFEVCNWCSSDPDSAVGVLRFDPAVLVDDDGRVYGYWGFERSFAAELDPTTMATVKPGTAIVEDMIPGRDQEGEFRFFEASSIRKVADKYVFIYSRWTRDGEFGLPQTNYTLAYAFSDHPLGPWTYGGTIIDGRAREVDVHGDTIASAVVTGNTHGSICQVNGQWYVFYHRQTGLNEFARQAMVAPIEVSVLPGPGGRVFISEGEVNSQGFALLGLYPLERHSAGIACWLTGPQVAEHHWPENVFYGSYVEAGYGEAAGSNFESPYALPNNSNRVVNNTDGSIVGYKYFNFSVLKGRPKVCLLLKLVPQGVDGRISVWVDRPWAEQGGRLVGAVDVTASMPQVATELAVSVPDVAEMPGEHALFLKFESAVKQQSVCTLEELVFSF